MGDEWWRRCGHGGNGERVLFIKRNAAEGCVSKIPLITNGTAVVQKVDIKSIFNTSLELARGGASFDVVGELELSNPLLRRAQESARFEERANEDPELPTCHSLARSLARKGSPKTNERRPSFHKKRAPRN